MSSMRPVKSAATQIKNKIPSDYEAREGLVRQIDTIVNRGDDDPLWPAELDYLKWNQLYVLLRKHWEHLDKQTQDSLSSIMKPQP